MKEFIKRILFGNTEIREYSTVTITDGIQEKVFLQLGGIKIDISDNQWVLCLEPIVFGIWFNRESLRMDLESRAEYKMFISGPCNSDRKEGKSNITAVLVLDYFGKIEEVDGTLFLLRLKKSNIHHINIIKSVILFSRYYKKPKLSFPKFKSLVSAYSYPRRVRIVSFKKEDYYNIFPMDLVGAIPKSNRYIFGLRHTNTTLSKIIETKKLVVSEISYKYKDIIYQLGKHHGANPPNLDSLSFRVVQTEVFGFYIPEWADDYKEIQIQKTVNLGSHMLMWGDIMNHKLLNPPSSYLFHIHFLLDLFQKRRGYHYIPV